MSMSDATADLLRATFQGSLTGVREAVKAGADVDFVPANTGLAALHLAVGRSHFAVLKFLVEEALASIRQDGFGRWPTLIAAQCQASEEVCDYIVEREAEALGTDTEALSSADESDRD